MLCIFLAYCEYSNVDMQDEQILRMFVPLLVFTQFILQAGQVDIELFVQYGKTWTLELGQFGFQVQTNTKKTKNIIFHKYLYLQYIINNSERWIKTSYSRQNPLAFKLQFVL